jgi:hypothetical protein
MFSIEELEGFKKELPLHVDTEDNGRVLIMNNKCEKILYGSGNPEHHKDDLTHAKILVEMANTFKKDFLHKEKHEWLDELKKNPDPEQFGKLLELCSQLFYDNFVLNAQVEALVYTSVVTDKANAQLGRMVRERDQVIKTIRIGDQEMVAVEVEESRYIQRDKGMQPVRVVISGSGVVGMGAAVAVSCDLTSVDLKKYVKKDGQND